MVKVKKGNLVILEYKTYVEGKLVDSSEMHKPIEIVYGFTAISPELEKNLKDKEEGYEFEIKQNINSEPIAVEFTYETFDEDTLNLMKQEKEIELEINGFWYPFKVLEISEDENKVVLQYEDPYAGKNVLHKLKIKKIEDLPLKKIDK